MPLGIPPIANAASQADMDTLLARVTQVRSDLWDRLAIFAAGGAGELTPANAALLARLSLLAAGGAGELTPANAALLGRLSIILAGGAGELTPANAALLSRLSIILAGGAGELTPGRVLNLDAAISSRTTGSLANLDVAVSSRTTGSLANLDAAVSSRAASTYSPIQSVQFGTVQVAGNVATGDATIAAVVIAKSVVVNLGRSTSFAAVDQLRDDCRLSLPATTTVRATRQGSPADVGPVYGFVVVEYK